MIEILSETVLGLHEAAKRLPTGRRGRPVHHSCLLRWVVQGVRLPDGNRVRLEAARLGKRWFTSVEAIERFVAKQTPCFDEKEGQLPRSPHQRRRASELAGQELDKIGV